MGTSLYLVKNSRPNTANQICLWSKRWYKTNHGLKIELIFQRNKSWNFVCYSDSIYTGDKDTRRVYPRFASYVCSLPISWRSKAEPSVTLWSSEAEWIALSQAVKVTIFLSQLITRMKTNIQYPMIVHVNNMGEIFITQIMTTMSHFQHVCFR